MELLQKLLPQLVGFCGMACLCLSYQQKKRERLLACKLGADALWVVHYLLLGAAGGAIPNFSGIFRELVFMQRGKKRWADTPLWPAFFIAVNLALALATWKTPLSLIPVTASAFVTVSLWVRNPKLTRIILVPVCTAFLVYDCLIGSYAGIVNEAFGLVSLAVSYFRNDRKAPERGDDSPAGTDDGKERKP